MNTLREHILSNDNNLSVYFTAGYPSVESLPVILNSLNKTAVDFIEIGIPFSDPLADGPIIQDASQKALDNGMSLKLIFEHLAKIKNTITKSYLLMGYLNSVMAYGLEKFYSDCQKTGVCNVILPDLPLDEYLNYHKSLCEKYNVNIIFLITPDTPAARIRLIDKHSKSFIYLVSDNSTTGTNNKMQVQKIQKIKNMKLHNPIIIGFGISNQSDFKAACKLAHGAIIGSAFIKCLGNEKELDANISDFVKSILS
jgi:tryptophan synthase alpha chain